MKFSVGTAVTAAALAATLTGPASAREPSASAGSLGAVASTYIDIDLAGWQSFGEFGNPANTRLTVDVGIGTVVTGFAYIDLAFTAQTYAGNATSWLQDLTLSVNNTSGSLFLDWSPSDVADGGSFGPASGAWGGASGLPGNFGAGGPFTAADGFIVVTVYDVFDNPLGDNGEQLDTAVSAGTLRVFLSPIPEPGTYALMALGLVALGAAARRRTAAG